MHYPTLVDLESSPLVIHAILSRKARNIVKHCFGNWEIALELMHGLLRCVDLSQYVFLKANHP